MRRKQGPRRWPLTLSNRARCRSSAEPVAAVFASFEIMRTGPKTSSSTDDCLPPFPRPADSVDDRLLVEFPSDDPSVVPATACSFWWTEDAERNAGGGSNPLLAAPLDIGLLLPVTRARRPEGEVEPANGGATRPKAGIRLPTAG